MLERDLKYLQEKEGEGWGKTRDSQRGKVYRAEQSVRRELDLSKDGEWGIKNVQEAVEFTESVLRSRWWKSYITPYTIRKFDGTARVNRNSRRRSTAIAQYTRWNGTIGIDMPTRDWAWNKMVILHEIAHFPTSARNVPAHGWLFCTVFLDLVRRFMSKEVWEMLRDSFDEHNVRWRRPRRISEERREILSKRMTALAANRWGDHEKKEKEEKFPNHIILTRMQSVNVHNHMDNEMPDDEEIEWDFMERDGNVWGRMEVTEDSIREMVYMVREFQYWDRRSYMSSIGILKKMKSHDLEMYRAVCEDMSSQMQYLPRSVQGWE